MTPRPLTFREQISLLLDRQSGEEQARAEAAIARVLARVSARLMAESFGKPSR